MVESPAFRRGEDSNLPLYILPAMSANFSGVMYITKNSRKDTPAFKRGAGSKTSHRGWAMFAPFTVLESGQESRDDDFNGSHVNNKREYMRFSGRTYGSLTAGRYHRGGVNVTKGKKLCYYCFSTHQKTVIHCRLDR